MAITQEMKKPYNRIPEIVLPEYAPRVLWVSDIAQQVWGPRFNRISHAYLQVEKENVARGIRNSYLTPLDSSMLQASREWALANKLELVELGKEGATDHMYSSKSTSYVEGQKFTVRCAFTRPELKDKWVSAWQQMNNDTIGELLGYPKCCRDWFKHYWQENNYIDDILAMYENSNFSTDGPWQLNFFYRYMGVRLVSHMPCSFNCEDSLKIATSNLNLFKELGYEEEVKWIEEILNWPVRWSSLHGICEIRCPVFKLSHKTDFLAEEFSVDKQGDVYPEEGASGVVFPWKRRKKTKTVLENKSFNESLKDAKLWEDNGFTSEAAMNSCHSVILQILSSFKVGSVLDLGSGNGLLLKRIKEQGEIINTYGIEIEEDRYNRGLEVHPEGIFRKGTIFDFGNYTENYYNYIILMPGRLTEVDEKVKNIYVKFLKERADNFVLYLYGDWISRYNENMLSLFKELDIDVKVDKVIKTENVHIILGEIK
jgi:hypothetical protein